LESILRFDKVTKVFRSSIAGRHLYTLGPVDLEVERGEILGYLGPNGAGKTTTIKLAVGLLWPSSGEVTCFGKPSSSIEARSRIGFLPEHPYFYQHLTALELLEFYGEVCGMDKAQTRCRADDLLRLTGIHQHKDTPVDKFSKGMLQRLGLAQALINDPELVLLDEPLSGLDPVGRREVRDLILKLKTEGKTVFLSSHILQDVEMICDRVAILSAGRIREVSTVAEVLYGSVERVEIVVQGLTEVQARELGVGRVSERADRVIITLPGGEPVNGVISQVVRSGGKITAVTPLRRTLEEYFMRKIEEDAEQIETDQESDLSVCEHVSKGGSL
jgi:ABC-2 type transport system ATP-binding protein